MVDAENIDEVTVMLPEDKIQVLNVIECHHCGFSVLQFSLIVPKYLLDFSF